MKLKEELNLDMSIKVLDNSFIEEKDFMDTIIAEEKKWQLV